MSAKLIITLKRSPIGNQTSQRLTVRALGFKKLQQTRVHNDTAVIRGMIHKVKHLVDVEAVAD